MGTNFDTPPEIPKLLIVGYGRHGKDYAAECLSRITHLRYGGSTSWAALPDIAEAQGVHPQVAWERRHQHRTFWYDMCNILRRDDPLILVKRVLRNADMVVGIRDIAEIQACRASGIFKHILWVDASERLGPVVDSTVTFGPEHCDAILNNNSTKEDLWGSLFGFAINYRLPVKYHDIFAVRAALRGAGL